MIKIGGMHFHIYSKFLSSVLLLPTYSVALLSAEEAELKSRAVQKPGAETANQNNLI